MSRTFIRSLNCRFFKQLIDEHVEHENEQWATLQQAEGRPHVLDDEIVNRLLNLYSEAPEVIDCYRRQLAVWKSEAKSQKQRQEIQRLEHQVGHLHQTQTKILKLAQSFEGKTIDSILQKSDLEVGLELFNELFEN